MTVPRREREAWSWIVARLEAGQGLDETVDGMQLHFDRPLPFLCVYRAPAGRRDAGTRQLVQSEAAYLTAPAKTPPEQLSSLLHAIVCSLSTRHGGCLLLEVWSRADAALEPPPRVRVLHHRERTPEAALERLVHALKRIRFQGQGLAVERTDVDGADKPGLPPLLSEPQLRRCGCALLGVELQPFYRSRRDAGATYPLLFRSLRRRFADALRRGLFAFLASHTHYPVRHYLALGPRVLRDPIPQVDQELACIERGQDFLLEFTPVNAAEARHQFASCDRQRAPQLVYRPTTVDPDLLKRRLYALPVQDIDDPVMEELCLEKRDEIDLKLNMLKNRGTPRFLYASLQLHGPVEPELLAAALEILARVVPDARRNERERIGAHAFAERARGALDRIRREVPQVSAGVEVRDDVIGLLVSRHTLLVGEGTRIAPAAVEAMIAHEVETHILTHVNGSLQPLRLLSVGLLGYDALQEGLAVLSEHLTGGLTPARLRLLAGRVVGANALMGGASFVDTYRLLERTHGFAPDVAFGITLRLYRGGGLMKDAVYLRGLLWLLDYLGRGDGELEPLYQGKIGTEHLDVVKELRHRSIVQPARLLPRYLEHPDGRARLQRIRARAVRVWELASEAA